MLHDIIEIASQQTGYIPAAHPLPTVLQKADCEGDTKTNIKIRKISVGLCRH